MRKTFRLVVASAALLPGLAMADAANFNYVEVGYLTGKQSGTDINGWGMRGSVELVERFFLTAGFSDLNDDTGRDDFRYSMDNKAIGLGYVFGENPTASVYGTVSYVDMNFSTRVDSMRFSSDADGYELGLGARINASPEAEVRLAVKHSDLGGGDTNTIPSVALIYKFTRQLAGFAEYERKTDYEQLGLGFRIYF